VRLVKTRFVPLTVDGRIINIYRDAEVDFLKTADCVANGACGGTWVITASGKRLERGEMVADRKSFQLSLERSLKTWAALPAAERTPGAGKVGERGPIDPKRAEATPPADCLILRVYNRQLERDAKGTLRYTVAEDYLPTIKEKFPVSTWAARFAEVAHDCMWITRGEWQALMPANPRKDQAVKVPTTLIERVFRFHLDPARGFGESNNFAAAGISNGEIRLTVEEVSATEVRLRLDGQADLRNDKLFGGKKVAYQPRLLGYLAYDRVKKVFTRFDVVALGNVSGSPVGENFMGERVGSDNPLGIAFELVTKPTPADYLSPRGVRNDGGSYDVKRYLGTAK